MSNIQKRRIRRGFDIEFKKEAVRAANTPGVSVAETARNLDLDYSTLRRWIKEFTPVSPENGSSPDLEKMHLRKQIKQLREERDILKKAIAFFAKTQE